MKKGNTRLNIFNQKYEDLIDEKINSEKYIDEKYMGIINAFIKNPKSLSELTDYDLTRFKTSKNGLFINYFNDAVNNGKIKISDIVKYSISMSAKPLITSKYDDPGSGPYISLDHYFAESHISNLIKNWDIEKQKKLIEIDVNYVLNYIEYTYKTVNNSKECENELTELLKTIYPEHYEDLKPILDYIINSKVEPYELKILFNKQIVLTNSIQDIKSFIENSINYRYQKFPEEETAIKMNESLANLVEKAYGNRASNIIKSRPKLNVENINSLEVFDNRILNNFGESFVHELISYNVPYFSKFLLITKDPLSLIKFTNYYDFIASYYGYDISIFEIALSSFFENEELLKNITINLLSNEDKNELIEYIMNYHRIDNIYKNQESMFNKKQINNINDIKIYNSEFKLSCLEFINQYDYNDFLLGKTNFKEVLSNYFFNMNYSAHAYDLHEDLYTNIYQSLQYNIIVFGQTELDNLTKEEQTILSVANEICTNTPRNNDENEAYFNSLKLLARQLDSFDINAVNNLFKKLKQKYVNELNNKLLDPNKLDNSCRKNLDNIDVYLLNGQDFCTSVHITGMQNSNRSIDALRISNSFHNFEGQAGVSTVSTFLIDSKNEESIQLGIGFGFTQIEDDEFLCLGNGKGGTSVTHNPKTINPKSSVNDDFSSGAAELSFYRRNRNYKKRNNDGRKKLSYIYLGIQNPTELSELSELSRAKNLAKQYNVPIVIVDSSKYINNELNQDDIENNKIK